MELKLLIVSIFSFSNLAFAGTISSGGHIGYLYSAVCHTRNLSHFVYVGLKDQQNKFKVEIRNQDSTDPASLLRSLSAHQNFTQAQGAHFSVSGKDFSIDIRTDLRIPGGAGAPGSVNMIISGKPIVQDIACEVF